MALICDRPDGLLYSYKVGLLSDECVLAEEGERKVRYGAAVVMEE